MQRRPTPFSAFQPKPPDHDLRPPRNLHHLDGRDRGIRRYIIGIAGGYDQLTDKQRAMVRQLIDAEAASRRFAASQDNAASATNNASGAAGNLTYSIGTAADEAARLLANLNGVPGALSLMGKSVDTQITSIRAQNRALNLELTEGLSSAAANRRVQLQTMVETTKERGQPIHFDTVAAEWNKIDELDAVAKRTVELREKINEANRPARRASGGGGRSGGSGSARAAQMSEEQRAAEQLNDTLQDRLNSLEAERIALNLVSTGQFETAEAADLMAQAMVQGGGAVDAQTTSMIRQIDAAAKLNEELQKVAKDPVKEWMKSVPNWIEAGQQIEMGAINSLKESLAEFIKTGTFDIAALGESILGVIADIVADKAVAELANLLGRDEGKGLGGLLGGVLGSQGDELTGPTMGEGAAVAEGGVQAGSSISQAMIQAGQQVSNQIGQAMTQGGQQSAQQVQMGHAQGGQQAASAQRLAGVQNATQVRVATTTAGNQHASDVRTAITSAGQQHATMVSAASGGGGGGGGGLFGGLGGLAGQFLPMLFGAFSEGGMSGSPVGMAAMSPSAFRNAPHYSAGTANTSGIPAVLHPNEAVIPLSKGRKIPVDLGGAGGTGGSGNITNFAPVYNIQTPDSDGFRRSQKQLVADGASAAQRAMQSNR